jgi:hypothetical protein
LSIAISRAIKPFCNGQGFRPQLSIFLRMRFHRFSQIHNLLQ